MDFQTLNLLFKCNKAYSHSKIHSQELSDTECMICSFVYSNKGCSQEDVASALKTDKTTVAKALLTLEGKKLVTRTQDTGDRRKKKLVLTKAGEKKIVGLLNVHNDWFAEILSCLNAEEQANFENYCNRLLASAEALEKKETEKAD